MRFSCLGNSSWRVISLLAILLAACSGNESGTPGEAGLTSLLDIQDEAPGENCVAGGYMIIAGIDDNGNGTLDADEVDTSILICNGETGNDGTDGNDGCSSLIEILNEEPGENCADGGKKIVVGTDDGLAADGTTAGEACDGILDPGEIDQVNYLCLPEPGPALGTVFITVTTGMHEDAAVGDSTAPSFCLTSQHCYGPLNHDGPDDYARGLTDTYRIENIPLTPSQIEEITFQANGSDGWQPTCIEVQWNGYPLYCNDALEPFWLQTDGDATWTAQDSEGNTVIQYAGCSRGTCHPAEIVAGPIMGALTSTSAKIWVRTALRQEVEVRIHANSEDLPFSDAVALGLPHYDDDYAITLDVTDLEPSSLYYYSVSVGSMTTAPKPFLTPPALGTSQSFKFAMGSCTKVSVDPQQLVFDEIRESDPAFFLFLGDNHYANSGSLDRLRSYQKQARAVAARAEFLKSVPVYATWDDHDFIENNSGGVGFCDVNDTILNDDEEAYCGELTPPADTRFNENPATLLSKRDNALKAFKESWPNPEFGLPNTKGVFHSFSYGDADFFMLDSRYHRTPEFVPGTHSAVAKGVRLPAEEREMFGSEQIHWLKEKLMASTATFKFLASGSTWNEDGSYDSFAYFDVEREGLFDFIAEQNITGVIFLSGDIHRSGFTTAVPQNKAVTGGYDFPELISSPMANTNGGTCAMDGSEDYATTYATQCFNSGNYFMTIEVDTTLSDPRAVAKLFNASGVLQGTPQEIRLSQLTTTE